MYINVQNRPRMLHIADVEVFEKRDGRLEVGLILSDGERKRRYDTYEKEKIRKFFIFLINHQCDKNNWIEFLNSNSL